MYFPDWQDRLGWLSSALWTNSLAAHFPAITPVCTDKFALGYAAAIFQVAASFQDRYRVVKLCDHHNVPLDTIV